MRFTQALAIVVLGATCWRLPGKGGSAMKRLLLILTVAALIAALSATAAETQMSWYWCQDYYGNWTYCYY